MAKAVCAITFCLCVLGWTSSATAAEVTVLDPIRFSLEIRGERTDNRDAVANDKSGNVDFFIKPRIDALFNWDRTVLDFYYIPVFRWRSDPAPMQDKNELNHEAGVLWRHELSPRVKLRANDRFYRTDDPESEEDGWTRRRDFSYIRNRAGAGMNIELDRLTQLDVSGRHMMKRYEESGVANEADEDLAAGELMLWRQVQRTLAVYGWAEYSSFGYGANPVIDRDFDAHIGAVGIQKNLAGDMRLGARIGWQGVSYSDDRLGSDTSPFLLANVKGRTGGDARYELSVTHKIRNADVYPFASQEHTDFTASVSKQTTPTVTVGITGSYQVGRYEAGTLPGDVQELLEGRTLSRLDGNETRIVVEAEMAYAVSDRTTVKFVQRYEDLDSDVSVSFTKNTSAVALVQRF